jgi:hypothetical protein
VIADTYPTYRLCLVLGNIRSLSGRNRPSIQRTRHAHLRIRRQRSSSDDEEPLSGASAVLGGSCQGSSTCNRMCACCRRGPRRSLGRLSCRRLVGSSRSALRGRLTALLVGVSPACYVGMRTTVCLSNKSHRRLCDPNPKARAQVSVAIMTSVWKWELTQ